MKRLLLIILCSLLWGTAIHAKENTTAEYTVGIDDVLEINVLQPEKLTTMVIVSPDGSLSFPYIGNIYVKGLSLSTIQEEIQTRLMDGYMKYPVVSVSLKESRSRKFFVYGDVTRPGAYPMEDNTTVLKAISIAGGLTKFGTSSQIKLLRPKEHAAGYETIETDIKSVIKGAANADITLCPGDTIMVSEGKFFVYGDVARPGAYPMEDDTTVLKAISIAGGLSKFGAFSQVKLLRPKGHAAGYETIEVDIKSVMKGAANADITLCPGDTIMVSEGKFFVYGEVASPGAYSMEDDTTVLKAISIAGGLTKFGASSRVKVLRSSPEESGYETIKINLKEIMEGSQQADVMLKPGDTVVVMEGIF